MAVPRHFISLAWRAALAVAVFAAAWTATAAAAEHASFKAHVFPIIRQHCLECHRPGGLGYEASGLDLRTYEGLMKGTRHGPIVVPGDAFTSNPERPRRRAGQPRDQDALPRQETEPMGEGPYQALGQPRRQE